MSYIEQNSPEPGPNYYDKQAKSIAESSAMTLLSMLETQAEQNAMAFNELRERLDPLMRRSEDITAVPNNDFAVPDTDSLFTDRLAELLRTLIRLNTAIHTLRNEVRL